MGWEGKEFSNLHFPSLGCTASQLRQNSVLAEQASKQANKKRFLWSPADENAKSC